MLKKLLIAAAGLALSTPVLADGWDRGHYGKRYYPAHQRHYHPHYRPHRPVVVVHRPAPVVEYHYSRPHPGAIVFGAVLGAAIAHHVITGR